MSCEINRIILKDNGTVYGYFGNDDITTTNSYNVTTNLGAPISRECCEAFNYTFDDTLCKCLWKDPVDSNFLKLVLNSNNNDGELFTINENETCVLDVEFDFLLQFDINNENIGDYVDPLSIFNDIDITASIETVELRDVIPNVIYESPYTLLTAYNSDLLVFNDLGDYISGNTNTGLRITGEFSGDVINNITAQLGPKGSNVSADTFNSKWLTHKFTISDSAIIDLIANKKIKLIINITDVKIDCSILIDRVQINRICESVEKTEKKIIRCPGFEFTRVIDNKKSWDSLFDSNIREYDLDMRETNYKVFDNRLILNTKEIDLQIDPSLAIEENIFSYINSNYNCILSGDTVDFSHLLTTELSSVTSTDEFISLLTSELIDVKNRQVIQSYPTLRFLYDKYLNSTDYGCPVSGKYVYNELIKYSKSIGIYWTDIIEQLIPATTLWGSSYVYRNNIFDNNKFRYKQYTLFTCNEPTINDYGQPISSDTTIDVKLSEITLDGIVNPDNNCSGVYLVNINSNPEFRGSVYTITNGSNYEGGGTTIISENVES